jgi:hypothetical protein
MRVRLAAAVTAAFIAIPVIAVAAGASPSSSPRPGHTCAASTTPIEHKCGPKK